MMRKADGWTGGLLYTRHPLKTAAGWTLALTLPLTPGGSLSGISMHCESKHLSMNRFYSVHCEPVHLNKFWDPVQ